MTRTVAPKTDADQSTEAAHFTEHMAENFPDVKHGSAAWEIHVRHEDSDQRTVYRNVDLATNLYPAKMDDAPAWADLDDTWNCTTPMFSCFRSLYLRVVLRRHKAYKDEDAGTVTLGHLRTRIEQTVDAAKPHIIVERYAPLTNGTGVSRVERTELELQEAADLAHNILLLLDAASEA